MPYSGPSAINCDERNVVHQHLVDAESHYVLDCIHFDPGNRDIKQVPVLCYDTKNTWGRQECENMRPFCFGCMFLELLIDALCIVLGLFGHVSL